MKKEIQTGKPVKVTIFVDADLASNRVDRRSITGIIILIEGMPCRWFSKRQTSVETSTFSAEHSALHTAVEEAQATRHMLMSIGVPIDGPVEICVDNRAVVLNSTVPGSALKKKHISIAFHMTREAQVMKVCRIYSVSSLENPADIFTKPLPPALFKKHIDRLMVNRPPKTR